MSPRAAADAEGLLTAAAVRARAGEMLEACEKGALAHWRVDYAPFDDLARFVGSFMQRAYPDGAIPFHSRWRHFELEGIDRAAAYKADGGFKSARARSRAAVDLVVVSVLLDAGAGSNWRYRAADGRMLTRSEGLAAASLEMFECGLFSSDLRAPRQVDAGALLGLERDDLARGFQADADNALAGLEGRLAVLRGLGRAMSAAPELFSVEGIRRPAALFDRLESRAQGGAIDAPAILRLLLEALGPIWPGRLTLAGAPLGDVWRHPAIRRDDLTNGLVPFHKLSQWLAYSLIEPLEWAGDRVRDVDGLTGLAEYRNGGLFIDFDVLRPTDPRAFDLAHAPDSLLVVEWRALTVALLDRLAERLRRFLGRDKESLPLARILQGGTWSAGRVIANARRPGGGPPLAILSDGALF